MDYKPGTYMLMEDYVSDLGEMFFCFLACSSLSVAGGFAFAYSKVGAGILLVTLAAFFGFMWFGTLWSHHKIKTANRVK